MRLPQNTFTRTIFLLASFIFLMLVVVSCLKDKPETVPEKLEWNPEVAFPIGEDSFRLNTTSGIDTSLLELDSITSLPQWFDELEVIMEGTLDFNLTSISDNLDKLNRIMFRVNAYNGFPNQVFAQAYFQDAGMNTIDSMFFEGPMIIPPGRIQGNGETIQPSFVQQDAIFDKNRIQPLENATVIFFQATMVVSATDSALIPFYPDYHFDVGIGVMLDLSLEL